MKLVPKGWNQYQPIGDRIRGTKFIPFKVPLRLEVCSSLLPEEDWFTPAILLQKQPRLKTIIDLTDTSRYYDPEDFTSNGVTYIKINISGGGQLPPSFKIRQFYDAVDEFMRKYNDDPDALLGVHCTHGLNRTGFFICNYMVERLKFSPDDAISGFEDARGYQIKRQNFVNEVKKLGNTTKRCKNRRISNEYQSPLSDTYEEAYRSRQPYKIESRPGPSYNKSPLNDTYEEAYPSRRPYKMESRPGPSYDNRRPEGAFDKKRVYNRGEYRSNDSRNVDGNKRNVDSKRQTQGDTKTFHRNSKTSKRTDRASSSSNWRERP